MNAGDIEVAELLKENGQERRAEGKRLLQEHPLYLYAVTVDEDDRGVCRFCGRTIIRGVTVRGKGSWFDADPDESGRHMNHWVSCPDARRARAWAKAMSGHLSLGTP